MSQPLQGLTVLDLGHALAGPHAAQMLGDLGARVIKIEPPAGDESRGWGSIPAPETPTLSSYFMACNRNKESIVLDLKSHSGRATLLDLVRRSDVLVENFRAGVMESLGLSEGLLRRENRRLIILSVTGFGHRGPEADRPGYDQILQAEAGIMTLTGSGPTDLYRVGIPIGDLLAGIHGVVGVLAALIQRELSGEGTVVRTSLLAGLVAIHSFQGTQWTVGGVVPEACGNHHPSIAPYGLFRCSDASIVLAVGTEAMWRRFASAFAIDATELKYGTNRSRVQHRAELTSEIERRFAGRTRDELLTQLRLLGIPAGRLRTLNDVYNWAQVRAQDVLATFQHPTLGTLEAPGFPLTFDGCQPRKSGTPPCLGQDTQSVLSWLRGREVHSGPQEASAGGCPDGEEGRNSHTTPGRTR